MPIVSNGPVLITGAGGFIGGALADRLVENGAPVHGLVRTAEQARAIEARGIYAAVGDVRYPTSLAAAVRGCRTVYHCAAWMGRPFTWEAAFEVNVVGTRHLVEACLQAGVERLVHMSTIAVYGPTTVEVIDESTPVWPLGPYRGSKIAAEEEVELAARRGLDTVTMRPGQVFGPGDRRLARLALRWLRRGLPVLVSGGEGQCHPIYVDNLVDALIAARGCLHARGYVFNVADRDMPWREFLGWFARMAGRRVRSAPAWVVRALTAGAETVAVVTRRPAAMYRAELGYLLRTSRFSTERARTVLDWSPRVPLDHAMAATEAWLRRSGFLPARSREVMRES